MNTLLDQTVLICENMKKSFDSWCNRSNVNLPFYNETKFYPEEGRVYIKIIKSEVAYGKERKSVCGFVVKESPKNAIDNKTKRPFNIGDMLMAKSYTAPATNFARGNAFKVTPETKINWTGIM